MFSVMAFVTKVKESSLPFFQVSICNALRWYLYFVLFDLSSARGSAVFHTCTPSRIGSHPCYKEILGVVHFFAQSSTLAPVVEGRRRRKGLRQE
jgi:hypothetical protein